MFSFLSSLLCYVLLESKTARRFVYGFVLCIAVVWFSAFIWKPCANHCMWCKGDTNHMSVAERLLVNRDEIHFDCMLEWSELMRSMGITPSEFIDRYGDDRSIFEKLGIRVYMKHSGQNGIGF